MVLPADMTVKVSHDISLDLQHKVHRGMLGLPFVDFFADFLLTLLA